MRVAACLLLQACLLLFRLDLLPVWGDEQFTLDVCSGEAGQIVPVVAADNHPPGYYLLVWLWLRAVPGDPLVAGRLLSALLMLVASCALWRLFLRRLPDRVAADAVLLLWVLSPFALMYGRMARSYSLQLLLFLAGVSAAERALETRKFFRVGLLTALLLYVHYVPGFCLLVLLAVRLLLARRWRDVAVYAALVSGAYAPWLAVAAATASRELSKNVYLVFTGPLAEHPLRLGYTWVAWHFGETLPLPWIAAGLPVTAIGAALAVRAAARDRGTVLAFGAAASISYALVSRVVIFPLVPARLLFLLPFYWILAASGRSVSPRAARASLAVLLVLNTAAIANYFGRQHYLNKGYLIPFEELAARFQSAPGGAVLVDIDSVDTRPVWPRIPAGLRRGAVTAGHAAGLIREEDPVIYHVRGSIDRSSGRANDALDRELARTRACTVQGFAPYDRYDHWMMDLLGWPEKPSHMLQLVTCRR